MVNISAETPPAKPETLLGQLRETASRLGWPLPGGDPLWTKLDRGTPPGAALGRLAHALHAEWLKRQDPVPTDVHELFIDCALLSWQGLDGSERLRSGLYPPLIRAYTAAGRTDGLAALGMQLAPFGDDDDAAQALAVLLRQLRQQRQFDALRELLDALRPTWRPGRAWGGPLLAGVLALARDADDFASLRASATWLPELMDTAEADPSTDNASWRELGKVALRTMQVGPMQRVTRILLEQEGMEHSETQPLLIQMLGLLATFAPDETTRTLLAEAADQEPGHPAIQLAKARIAHAEGASLDQLAAILDGVSAAQPGGAAALSWLAGTRFHGGDEAGALALYEQLNLHEGLTPADKLRLSHLRSRDEKPAAPAAPAGPTNDEPNPWPAEVVGPFGSGLDPLKALLESSPTHDNPRSAEELAAAANAASEQWRQALPGLRTVSMQATLQLARHLAQLESAAFASHVQWVRAFPFALGPAYGRIDAGRCGAMSAAIHSHIIALADFALTRPQALQGPPGQASLRQALDLAELRAEARWALGQDEQALSDLDSLHQRLGPMGEAPLRELRARAFLTLGRLPEVASLLTPADGEVLPMREWADWLAAEQHAEHTLVDDPPVDGQFESVQPDGSLHTHMHQLAATRLGLVHFTDLRVRNSHLLIGPAGGILRPAAWHLSMGAYPYEHRSVRLRGGGMTAAGAVLRPARWRRVSTPVIVLANMDATYHRNYYHWLVLLLARVEALRARGLLVGGRKLLLPRELSSWMRSSLADLAIGEDQMLLYGADDDLQLTDAVLASPIDFASPSLIEGLRQAMWRHAGLDPAAPPQATRLIYISRRGEGRRPLKEETQILQAAEAMGFETIAPETLTLAEQVQLFATARGIAGPPGAAYTNLIWTQPGTRVLSIFKEEANLPTFVDLSILRGQKHRWLLGRNLPGYELMSSVNAPFSVDVTLAQRELAWVAGQTP